MKAKRVGCELRTNTVSERCEPVLRTRAYQKRHMSVNGRHGSSVNENVLHFAKIQQRSGKTEKTQLSFKWAQRKIEPFRKSLESSLLRVIKCFPHCSQNDQTC